MLFRSDVLSVGNSYSTEVQTGRYDAQGTLLLTGNGRGGLQPQQQELNLQADLRSLVRLKLRNGSGLFLFGANSDSLRAYTSRATIQYLAVKPGETYAVLTRKDGKSYRQEFYRGNTYLSASSRTLAVSSAIASVRFYDVLGKSREWQRP